MDSILVVRHPSCNRYLETYLREAGFLVLSASDYETGFDFLHQEYPDLLLLALPFLRSSDWAFIRLIQADPSLTYLPLMILTAHADENDKIFGLENGIDDFIGKSINRRIIVARIKALLRRCGNRKSMVPRVLQTGKLWLDPDRHELRVDGELVNLTRVEFGLLQTLMGSPGHAFTRDELAEKSLENAQEGVGRALDTHIKNLRRKIEPNPKGPILIQTIYGIGYKLVVE